MLALVDQPAAVRVVNHTHPEYGTSLAQFLAESRADALLLRGIEGEPVADVRRTPRMDAFIAGQRIEALSVPPQGGVLARVQQLPAAIDAATTAAFIDATLLDPGAVPLPIQSQVRALRRATVVLVDDLVADGVLRYVRKSARVVHVGKRGGCASTPQAFIEKLMVAEARRGERVVRLKGGDPFVFGRGGEECDALRAAGIEVEVINGLTAGIAAPAAIGIPVTDRRFTQGVVLVTGHGSEHEPDWAALARSGLTLVIYMGVARVQALVDALRSGGLPGDTPAAAISAAHTPEQRHALCTLGTLAGTIVGEGLASPAILVIGDVVQAAPMWASVPAHGDTAPRYGAA